MKHLSLCKQQLSVSVFVRIGAGAPPPCPHPARPRYLLLEMKELLSSESCHFGTRTGLPLSSTAGAGSEHRQLKTQNKPQVRICLQRCWQKNHPETTQGTSVSGSEGWEVEVIASHSQWEVCFSGKTWQPGEPRPADLTGILPRSVKHKQAGLKC